jgi:hypothetical protein
MSKGSLRRPKQVSDEQFADRWDAIFGHGECIHGVTKNAPGIDCEFCVPEGWSPLEFDPIGCAYQVATFNGKRYWKRLENGK